MAHIAEQQLGWEREDTLSVAEAIREAMDTATSPKIPPSRSSRSLRRLRPTPGEETGTAIPEAHLPLRKASAQGRVQQRKASAPKPLFEKPPPMPTNNRGHGHQLRGFHPMPVQPPPPHIDSFTASSEHAFAAREPRRPRKPALDLLEDQQQQVLQFTERRDFPERGDSRMDSSPIHPSPMGNTNALKSSRSVGDGLRGLRQGQQATAERWTPDRPRRAEDEVRASVRSALTSHSSLAHTSLNTVTTNTSLSSRSESLIQVKQDEESGLTDIDMSVDDVLGMYENGFDSARGSLDVRSEAPSLRSLHLQRSAQSSPPKSAPGPHTVVSQPSTPTKKRPHAAHRRSQSASILILGVPKSTRSATSPGRSPNRTATAPDLSLDRTSTPIVCNQPTKTVLPTTAVSRDRYGFKKASQYITVAQYDAWNEGYSKHLERRSKKWHTLMDAYGLQASPALRFPPKTDKIKRYVRKGIPPEYRGAAWFWYAGGPGRLAKEPKLYNDLVEKADPKKTFLSANDREHIERDLHRTFPDNIRFKPDPSSMLDAQQQAGAGGNNDDPETPILQSLRRVLQAFAIHYPSIGYCQSLNFIAGLLLLVLDGDEEKAFHLLVIVTTLHLPGTHGVALEGANVDIAVLMSCIRDSLPNIWAKLDDNTSQGPLRLPTVSLATTAWFMALFVGTLPIECVLRIWDCLFFEGSKTLFRVALAIFKSAETQIANVHDPVEVFQVVQTLPRGLLDVNGLLDVAFRRRGGFGGVSQGLVERRRAERRRVVKEGVTEMQALGEEGVVRRWKGRLRRGTGKI